MTDGISPEPATHQYALHTITGLPIDPDFPLYEHYPAMKLGVRESVRHYAALLAPLATKIMMSEPETTDWVLTAPPLRAAPSGANLIAWEVYRFLGGNPGGKNLHAVDLRYTMPNPQSLIFSVNGDFSRSGIEARINNRQGLLEGRRAPKPDPADFRGRGVIVINDINVTGTQQRFLQKVIEPVEPASIHWLYIFQAEAALGRSNPELEYSLNTLSLESFEDFAQTVASADIDYTSRCITRLLHYPESRLKPLIESLDGERRRRLHQLVIEEGAFTGGDLASKVALLRE